MDDVLDQYGKRYDPQHPQINIDEKSHQLLSTARGGKPMKSGSVRKVDYEYKRHGTVNHFVCVEPKAGKRTIRVTENRKGKAFAEFMEYIIMERYKEAEYVDVTIDNLNTHNDNTIIIHVGEQRGRRIISRIHWHYTPTHASWLNAAEIEIGVLTASVLSKRIGDINELKQEVAAYEKRRNREKAKINWKFTKQKAHEKFNIH